MTNVVAEIVRLIEEVRCDARFKEFESVMLYDIETADFGFLHHVGETVWLSEGPEGYLKHKIREFVLNGQDPVPEREIRKHGTELIKVLGIDKERLAQDITLCNAERNWGKKAIYNAIKNLYGMYGESLNEPFSVKFIKDTLDVETLPLEGNDRVSFFTIREKLNEKKPWEQLRIYKGTGRKYFYYALRDFEGLGDVRRFFSKNDDKHNNGFFKDVCVPVSNPGDPDEYIDLVLGLFGEDEVLPGDLNQVIYFLYSYHGDGLETERKEFKELFRQLVKSPRNRVDRVHMIKIFRIAAEIDVRVMENIVKDMRGLLEKLVSGEIPNDDTYTRTDLKDLCMSLINGQRNDMGIMKSGSWCVAPSATNMPGDARVYLAFFPTYIAVSILTRVLVDYPEIPEQIPNYEEVLRNGLKFATYRRLQGHGIGARSEMIDALEILSSGNVITYLASNPDFCPELLQILKDIKEELSDALQRGVTEGPWGEDYIKALTFVEGC